MYLIRCNNLTSIISTMESRVVFQFIHVIVIFVISVLLIIFCCRIISRRWPRSRGSALTLKHGHLMPGYVGAPTAKSATIPTGFVSAKKPQQWRNKKLYKASWTKTYVSIGRRMDTSYTREQCSICAGIYY